MTSPKTATKRTKPMMSMTVSQGVKEGVEELAKKLGSPRSFVVETALVEFLSRSRENQESTKNNAG